MAAKMYEEYPRLLKHEQLCRDNIYWPDGPTAFQHRLFGDGDFAAWQAVERAGSNFDSAMPAKQNFRAAVRGHHARASAPGVSAAPCREREPPARESVQSV